MGRNLAGDKERPAPVLGAGGARLQHRDGRHRRAPGAAGPAPRAHGGAGRARAGAVQHRLQQEHRARRHQRAQPERHPPR